MAVRVVFTLYRNLSPQWYKVYLLRTANPPPPPLSLSNFLKQREAEAHPNLCMNKKAKTESVDSSEQFEAGSVLYLSLGGGQKLLQSLAVKQQAPLSSCKQTTAARIRMSKISKNTNIAIPRISGTVYCENEINVKYRQRKTREDLKNKKICSCVFE